MTLTDFLLARFEDDERDARQRVQMGEDASGYFKVPTPSRIHAECEAKRRIVELHEASPAWDALPCPHGDHEALPAGPLVCQECGQTDGVYPCRTLAMLVQPYADHPDYREEWRR